MRDKVYMPKTAVEITYPEGTELFCIVSGRDIQKMECLEIANEKRPGVRFEFPLNAFIGSMLKLPKPFQKIAALKAILEIAEAAGIEVPKEDSPFDDFVDFIKRKERADE